jgi:polysaccharide pyruvyl transferase WcaK-like protein/MoaA/NifB/PqqE/SkfB family radical SAM enzyme
MDFEITPEELEKTLRDPLFKKVERVGVTGGEPTMREDLPDLYDAACKALPALKGMSIITNAIKEKDVIDRIERVHEVLKGHNKSFNIMVSLDGVGEVHGRHRGRPGNFESAMRVINHFRTTTDLPVIIGCTITKGNVWDMDDMLDFLQAEGLHGRFRMGEFIQRLYNDDLRDEIRNFSKDEVYHLLCFYERLIREFEPNPKYIRTYRSVQNILQGGERTIGCPYQGKGVVLDSKGEILYCAPKSEILGSTLETSAEEIYFGNKQEFERIREEHCSDCVHDYHAPPTLPELFDVYKEDYWRWRNGIHFSKLTLPLTRAKREDCNRILIAGWYGTETVGDKAILAGIIQHYQKEVPGCEILVASIKPFLTRRTLEELGISGRVIPVYSRAFVDEAAKSKEIVMGGGPLMDMESMSIPRMVVKLARKFNKKSVIFGCGLGPLRQKKYIEVAKEVLRQADEVKLRDRASVELANEWTGRADIQFVGDPAGHYLESLRSKHEVSERKPVLACFLREWPRVYYHRGGNYEQEKEVFEKQLADKIKATCKEFNLTPAFYSMHTYVVGGDDRKFYRRFLKTYFADTEYHFDPYPSSVESTVKAMMSSSINLCMRFHSVLFAKTLGTQYIAIDYTGGGKIKGLLEDAGEMTRYIAIDDVVEKKDLTLHDVLV